MAKDRFTIKLKCPNCGRSGSADAEEEDGWSYLKGDRSTFVTGIPEGFHEVDQRSGMASVDIFCSTCNVSAIGKPGT